VGGCSIKGEGAELHLSYPETRWPGRDKVNSQHPPFSSLPCWFVLRTSHPGTQLKLLTWTQVTSSLPHDLLLLSLPFFSLYLIPTILFIHADSVYLCLQDVWQNSKQVVLIFISHFFYILSRDTRMKNELFDMFFVFDFNRNRLYAQRTSMWHWTVPTHTWDPSFRDDRWWVCSTTCCINGVGHILVMWRPCGLGYETDDSHYWLGVRLVFISTPSPSRSCVQIF
jgi:hypothetical protein